MVVSNEIIIVTQSQTRVGNAQSSLPCLRSLATTPRLPCRCRRLLFTSITLQYNSGDCRHFTRKESCMSAPNFPSRWLRIGVLVSFSVLVLGTLAYFQTRSNFTPTPKFVQTTPVDPDPGRKGPVDPHTETKEPPLLDVKLGPPIEQPAPQVASRSSMEEPPNAACKTM